MTDVGLLYVGGVLFVNTVILSGDAEPRRTRRDRVGAASCACYLPSSSQSQPHLCDHLMAEPGSGA
jgi:hypothetical protein